MTPAELAAAGHRVSPAGHARLTTFVAALLDENQRLNLTAVDAAAELWSGHVCDSLALLPHLPPDRPATLLDLGSGGGLPGLVLACACEQLTVTLLDATRKKVAALTRIAASIGLANVRAVWSRAETLAHEPPHREQYDLVTARAVAALPVLLEFSSGFVRVGGACWFWKTPAAIAAESQPAARAAAACGLSQVETCEYALPAGRGPRVLLCYRKTAPLRTDLPRAPGRAARRPL